MNENGPNSTHLRTHAARQGARQWHRIGPVLLIAALAFPIAAGARSAAFVTHGIVLDRDDLTIWSDPDTIKIENLRTGTAGTAIIGAMGLGTFAAALVDLGGGEAVIEGDVIRFTLSVEAGTIIDSLHVLSGPEVAQGIAKVDLVVSRVSSGTGELAALDRSVLRAFPNPARVGQVRFAVRIPGGASVPRDATGVDLAIFDATGRMIHSERGMTLDGGAGILAWDGRTVSGERAAQGAYFVVARISEAIVEGRFLLVR